MDKRPILFLDSGIGGIPYCRYFHSQNPAESLLYIADRAHFPYGKREKNDLVLILKSLFERLIMAEDPKLAVLACNTATVSALDELRATFPCLPFVGTVPAVKPAVMESKKKLAGVLGTARTIEDPYIAELAAKYGNGCKIMGLAAPELVEFVEHRINRACENEKREMVRKYIDQFRAAGADALVLGCTHFLFLLEEFRIEAAPLIHVYDSIEGISSRIESILDADGGALRADGSVSGKNQFFVTGENQIEDSWRQWAGELGFSLSRFGDKT
ncbi:MAG: glutamate racemase [Treponema sp.]|jgi:glutamate racemase|nr:glutamate racemase [Treponema sp.]